MQKWAIRGAGGLVRQCSWELLLQKHCLVSRECRGLSQEGSSSLSLENRVSVCSEVITSWSHLQKVGGGDRHLLLAPQF